MSDWKEYSLGDISRNISRRFDFNAYPNVVFINTGDVLNNKFLHCEISNVKDLPGQAKKAIKKGDILYSEIRPGNGRYLFVDNDLDNYVVSTKFMVIEPNANIVLPEFLFLLLISNETTEYFKMIAESRSGTFPQITFDSVSSLSLNIPDKETQQKILDIITPLDDEIDLNTQINQTLEQIAQALFKSWFVDFDPVRAKVQALSDGMSLEQAELAAMQAISGKTPEELTALSQTQPDRYAELAETTKAFPCEMVEIDGVEVPKGWEVKPIELILDRLKNKQKLRKEEISFEGTIPVFEQGASILMGYHDKDAAFNASIDEPIFIFGDHTCITKLSTIPFSIYQNVIPLIGKNLPTYWVYCAIQNKQTFQEYRRHWAELIVKEVVVPDNINLCQYFSKKVKELFFKIDINHQENRTLIETRDLLLPRLLNGEI